MKQYRESARSSLPIPNDTYLYSIATTAAQDDIQFDTYQSTSKSDRLVIISSDDSLLVLDPETLKVVPDGHYSKANKSVTTLKRFAAVGQQCNVFLTAGRDGIVRGWDLRSSKAVLEFEGPKNRTGECEPISAIDANFETHSIAAGTELAEEPPGNISIQVWDVRKPQNTRVTYSESHTDTITELRFLPYPSSSSTVLMSGSTDGLVNIFNTTVAEEEDAILQVINNTSAIHHTGLIGDDIYALGTEETLSFYAQQNPNLEQKDPDPFLLGDIREQWSCEYAIKIHNHMHTPLLAVGSHTDVQNLKFLGLKRAPKEESPTPKWTSTDEGGFILNGGHGTELVRDFFVATDSKVVFTCGEDGVVKQWTDHDAVDIEMSGIQSSKRKLNHGRGKTEKRQKA
jgi:WD repeat-containing protein 89